MNSSFGKLNVKDFVKGAWMAAYSSALGAIYLVVQNNGFDFSPQSVDTVKTAVVLAVLTYFIKNTTTSEKGNVLGIGDNK